MTTEMLKKALEMMDIYSPPRRDAAALEAALRAICARPDTTPEIKAYAADALLRAGIIEEE